MKNPAVDVARERNQADDVVTLSTGVKARLVPVAASLIQEVTSRIRDPEIPVFLNPEKGREEINPNDPTYLRELELTAQKRGAAAMDAMVMFGVELLDGLPEDDNWLKKLQLLQKFGHIDLSGFDLSEPLEQEFLYKKHFAVGSSDLMLISRKAGVSEEAVQRAAQSFRSQEAGDGD